MIYELFFEFSLRSGSFSSSTRVAFAILLVNATEIYMSFNAIGKIDFASSDFQISHLYAQVQCIA